MASEVFQIIKGTLGNLLAHSVDRCCFLNPWMIQRIQSCYSFFRFISQQFFHKILCIITDWVPFRLVQSKFSFKHSLDDVLVASTIEWRVTTEKNVKNNTATPQVTHIIVTLLKNFWCYIIWCAKLLTHFLATFVLSRRAKVNYGNSWILAIFIKKKILRLKVSMHDVVLVTVVDCGQNLLDDVCSILFAKVLLRSNSLKKFTSIAQFCDKEVSFVVLEKFIQL